MDVRALLLGSKLKIAATALGLIVASLAGAVAVGMVGPPVVVGVDNRFGPVTERTTVVETDLIVHNPNPFGIELGNTTVDYTVKMNDVGIAAGHKEGLDVDPGNTTLPFSTEMQNDKIPPWWVSHVRNDERTTVSVDATIQTGFLPGRSFGLQQNQEVETDIIGQFNSNETRPIEGPSNPLYSNPVLYVNETRGEWGEVTDQRTPIDMAFVVYNPQSKPYAITEVGYEVTMNGVPVGEGATERTYVIPAGTTETIETTPVISNGKLDEWWVTHLQNDQVTQLRIDFYARVRLPTGNEIRVPLDRLTYEKTIETDIFGNEAGSSAGDGPDEGDASPTGAGTTDAPADSPGGSPTDATTASPPAGEGSPTSDDGVLGAVPRLAAPRSGGAPLLDRG